MSYRKARIVVVGGGAAGIAAARRLHDARVDYLLVEARARLGGRAVTFQAGGYPLDLGCGWFHSADRNPWPQIAQAQGRAIDRSPPPWQRQSYEAGFPIADQKAFLAAGEAFRARMERADLTERDRPAADFLAPADRWNPLLNAVSTYVSGTELARVSARDLLNYEDDDVNWRAPDGYGAVVTAHGAGLNAVLDCRAEKIEWGVTPLKLQTSRGSIECDAVIVSLPTDVIAARPELFDPLLPEKTEAAGGLPLGLADKLFLSLLRPEEFEKDSRIFGHIDRAATAIYHMRPFARPLIECYFGGACAQDLETSGEGAFFEFARDELVGVLGSDFASRIAPLPMHLWRQDPYARGSYSCALPHRAGDRRRLAEPVEGRLFFAGEACSLHSFSTAHGAYFSGIDAADAYLREAR